MMARTVAQLLALFFIAAIVMGLAKIAAAMYAHLCVLPSFCGGLDRVIIIVFVGLLVAGVAGVLAAGRECRR